MIYVALADDHQSVLDGLELMLKTQKNIEIVASSTDPRDLLKVFAYKHVDVLITDVKMPIMDGYVLAEKFLNIFPKSKVVVLSMFDTPTILETMLTIGATGYILKTSSLNELVRGINAVKEGKRFFDQNLHYEDENCSEDIETTSEAPRFTKTEKKILKAIAEGKSSEEMAEEFCSAFETIIKHRKNIIRKLNLKGKNELLRYAYENKYSF